MTEALIENIEFPQPVKLIVNWAGSTFRIVNFGLACGGSAPTRRGM